MRKRFIWQSIVCALASASIIIFLYSSSYINNYIDNNINGLREGYYNGPIVYDVLFFGSIALMSITMIMCILFGFKTMMSADDLKKNKLLRQMSGITTILMGAFFVGTIVSLIVAFKSKGIADLSKIDTSTIIDNSEEEEEVSEKETSSNEVKNE